MGSKSAADYVNWIMDFLVVAAPAGYMIWAGITSWRQKQRAAIVAQAAALPEVARIVATPEIAAQVDDPTVTSR